MNEPNSSYQLPVAIPDLRFLQLREPFSLEAGGELEELTLAYHTYGTLNRDRSNVIWVCHALTANSAVASWWEGLFGEGRLFDPTRYFIVCANLPGSCYGSTGPRSRRPGGGGTYGMDFPLLTMRDAVRAYDRLREFLGIERIALCIGGSCGGHQVMEFAWLLGIRLQSMALLVTSARETPWAIAIHEAQRLALRADPTLYSDSDRAGEDGMRAARGMGLVSYRTFESYCLHQAEQEERLEDFRAASYIRHQGEKLARRFYGQCYYHLTRVLDSHDIGRGRGGAAQALRQLTLPSFVLSISSDLLIPPAEQAFLADNLPNAHAVTIASRYGHDGFLIETETIGKHIRDWLTDTGIGAFNDPARR